MAETAIVTTTPMQLIDVAINKGAGVEQLSQLMDLQERWEQNEAKKAFVRAMSMFRENCPPIYKTKAGHNSSYAPLPEVLKTIRNTMHECKLTHHWESTTSEDITTVVCVVTHELGHSEKTSLSAGAETSGSKNSVQALGSTVSYLQRYTLLSILGISADDDNDGAGETISDKQLAEIEALAQEVGVKTTDEKFVKYLKVDSLDQVLAKNFKSVIAVLEKKR